MASPSPLAALFNKAEWGDVVPIQQYETMDPLAPILYPIEYKDVTDYFRAVVKAGEKSPRVMRLTEALVRMNPGHYSAWQYRFDTIKALSLPLDVELVLMDELAVKHLKTYQVWHHRRLLITLSASLSAASGDPSTLVRAPKSELAFVTASLKTDSKNYHTWSYRQWLLAFVNDEDLWSEELDYVDELIGEDVRNNSAWHHRFFVVWMARASVAGKVTDERVLLRELRFTKQMISLAPNNVSAWNYLRGVLDRTDTPYYQLLDFVQPYTVVPSKSTGAGGSRPDIVDVDNPPPSEGAELPAAAAMEFAAEAYEMKGQKEDIAKAVKLWKLLERKHDTIRKVYWEYRIRNAGR